MTTEVVAAKWRCETHCWQPGVDKGAGGAFIKQRRQTAAPLPVCVPTSQGCGWPQRVKPYFKGSDLLSKLGDPGGNSSCLSSKCYYGGKKLH